MMMFDCAPFFLNVEKAALQPMVNVIFARPILATDARFVIDDTVNEGPFTIEII